MLGIYCDSPLGEERELERIVTMARLQDTAAALAEEWVEHTEEVIGSYQTGTSEEIAIRLVCNIWSVILIRSAQPADRAYLSRVL